MNDTPRVRLVPEAGGLAEESVIWKQPLAASDEPMEKADGTRAGAPVRPEGLPLQEAAYAAGQTVAQAVYLSGLFRPPALCSGLARCGRCRMRFIPPPGVPLPEPSGADTRAFTARELDAGMRLACRHVPVPGLVLELPPDALPFAGQFSSAPCADQSNSASFTGQYNSAAFADQSGSAPCYEQSGSAPRTGQHDAAPPAPSPSPATTAKGAPARLLLAVDLGTTSLQWRLSAHGNDARHVDVLWEGRAVNPQMGAGSDVISRIAAALRPGGRERLRDLTLAALQEIVAESGRIAARRPSVTGIASIADIASIAGVTSVADVPAFVCLAANPAMTAITLGLDVTGLAAAPLSLPYAGGGFASLPDLPPVWIPPQLSPFVGGDVSAGYASLALNPDAPPPDYPFLLADMGTNGEFLLALSPDEALAASVALGPALEGIGLAHGSDARPGAVIDAAPTPSGLALTLLPAPFGESGTDCGTNRSNGSGNTWKNRAAPVDLSASPHAPGPLPVAGITGAGYLALLDALRRCGGMDRHGHFASGNRFVTLERDTASGQDRVILPGGLALYASDVEEALKVKAAFSLGVSRLLDSAGLATTSLCRVYLAGALGFHAKTSALANLGFFPPGMEGRITAIGNSSLAGAALLAASKDARDALPRWSASVSALDLAADPVFAAGFASHMRFAW